MNHVLNLAESLVIFHKIGALGVLLRQTALLRLAEQLQVTDLLAQRGRLLLLLLERPGRLLQPALLLLEGGLLPLTGRAQLCDQRPSQTEGNAASAGGRRKYSI